MWAIESINLSHTYNRGTPLENKVLDNINIQVARGEFISIIGVTGSGKTTLIQHFNGLLAPQTGKLKVLGMDCHLKKARSELWRQVGLVFQYPDHMLFEETVYQEIAFGLKNLGIQPAEITPRVLKAALKVGLPREIMDCSPLVLSGGIKRKVALASVLAMEPKVLILDEPTAGLEPTAKEQLLITLKNLQKETKATVIMVTHAMDEAAAVSDRLLVLHHGQLVLTGTPLEVFTQAGDLFAMGLAVPVEIEVLYKLQQGGVPVHIVIGLRKAVEEIANKWRSNLGG